jgi:rRNA-processing protein FCF1
MEANARKEGSRTVTERHLTRFIKEIWSPQLVSLGIDAAALDEYVRRMELGADWFREMIAASWHGFLDANTIIQGKDLSNIFWLEETGQKRVTLWISSTLLEELDRLKFYHNSKRVKTRATRFGKWLAPHMEAAVTLQGPGIEVRDNVVLRVGTEGTKTSGHDTDHLQSAMNFRDHGIPVTIVTQDLGLQARAIAAGAPVLRLSDQSLLPAESEDQGTRSSDVTRSGHEG